MEYGLPLDLGLKQRACDDVTMKQWTESITAYKLVARYIHGFRIRRLYSNATIHCHGQEKSHTKNEKKAVQNQGSCKYIFNGDKYIIVRSPDAVHMYGKGNAKDNVHTSLKCLVGSGREARNIKIIRGMVGSGCLAAKGAFS